MTKPVCVPCQRFFRPLKNGFACIEGMPDGNDTPPGTQAPERWSPYKLLLADKWQCRGCGATILVGFGGPIAIQHQPDFAAQVERAGATFQINDC